MGWGGRGWWQGSQAVILGFRFLTLDQLGLADSTTTAAALLQPPISCSGLLWNPFHAGLCSPWETWGKEARRWGALGQGHWLC